MNTYISVILTLLTIITGILTILSFANARKKDSNDDSEQKGAMGQKISNIDTRTLSMEKDIQEIRKTEQNTMQLAIEALASAKSAHKRLDAIENRLNKG